MSDTLDADGSTSTNDSALVRLPAVPVELARAVEALVALKYEADRLAGSAACALPHPALTFNTHGTTSSFEFMRTCLPFLTGSDQPSVRMLVPTSQVAGESWRWKPGRVKDEDEEALIAYLTNDARADRRDPDHAGYIAWPALGLIVAVEGKNRVALLQSRHIGWTPADVDLVVYPEAARLARYTVIVGGRKEVWAVLDGRYVERIPLHAAGRDVLTAYGVALPTPWPDSFPRPDEVLALLQREGDFQADLAPLQQDAASAYDRIAVSVSDLHGLSGRPAPLLSVAAAFLVSAVIALESTGWIRFVAALVAASVAGGFACWRFPLFTARRRWIRGE